MQTISLSQMKLEGETPRVRETQATDDSRSFRDTSKRIPDNYKVIWNEDWDRYESIDSVLL